MAYPRFQLSRNFRLFTRTAGDLTLNSAGWANLPTIGTTFDIVLEAQEGDVIEAGIAGFLGVEAFVAALDIVTIVSTAYYSSFSTGSTTRPSNGAGAWRTVSGASAPLGGSMLYVVPVGAIAAGGQVTIRCQYSQGSAGNKTLYASTTTAPFQVWAKNLGPSDPE